MAKVEIETESNPGTPAPPSPPTCPRAPKKPRIRRCRDTSGKVKSRLNSTVTIHARDALASVPEFLKGRVLHHISPVVARIVFTFYCDFAARNPMQQFTCLIEEVPDLETQIMQYALSKTGITEATWKRDIARAEKDCTFKASLADSFVAGLAPVAGARRQLMFA